METKRHHGRSPRKAEEEEGVAEMGVENIVHLTHVLGVTLARLRKSEGVLKVTNHTVTGFLKHHDEHSDENKIELFLGHQLQAKKSNGWVRCLTLQGGQRTAVISQLTPNKWEGEQSMDTQKQQRKAD